MFFENSREVGLLFVAKIKTNFLQRTTFENPTASFVHAMFFQPSGEGGLVMFPKVPLNGTKTNATECGNAMWPVVGPAGDFTPGQVRSGNRDWCPGNW